MYQSPQQLAINVFYKLAAPLGSVSAKMMEKLPKGKSVMEALRPPPKPVRTLASHAEMPAAERAAARSGMTLEDRAWQHRNAGPHN